MKRIAIAAGLVALCAISIFRVARPPTVIAATAPDSVFSAARAMRYVAEIARRPHPIGTRDHDGVRDYISGQLSQLEVSWQIQSATGIGTRYPQAGRVQNILARIRGTDSSRKAVLIVAHYDGVGAGPAASDDAAGCAAILETLRALRSRRLPLKHDVIVLFTDGEEAGLLGAAAFVREHPWAHDVAIVLNFEARGTAGRSFMFETGPGNLDAARALRTAPDATAGSVYATIYRMLPNDTDLSELSILGRPALNFAFADGVERYHTSRDDVAHLDEGSVQHHGSQMLALARTFANGPLPRPVTGDGVFFDLPLLGLVVYPQGAELPLAILGVLLVSVVLARDRKGVAIALLVVVATLVVAGIVGWAVGSTFHGPAMWKGLSAVVIVLLSLAVARAGRILTGRRTGPRGVHTATLVLWLLAALLLAIRVPGVSYLFTWPLLFAAGAAIVTRAPAIGQGLAAVVTLLLLSGFTYGVSVVMLGVTGMGAIALALVTAMVALLLAPQFDVVAGALRWAEPAMLAVVGLACYGIVLATSRPNADHPLRSALIYAENADSTNAWLGASAGAQNSWIREVIGPEPMSAPPAWTSRISEYGGRFVGRRVERVSLDAPDATLVSDSVRGNLRRVVLRVGAPDGATTLLMRARGTRVVLAEIDGRVVDTDRYRYHGKDWVMQYSAVPHGGALVSLSIPAGSALDFELAARSPEIPSLRGVRIPTRPSFVVPSQTGDATIVYKDFHF